LLLPQISLIAQPYWMWENPKPTGMKPQGIASLDNNTAISVFDYGTITKTTNGGISWYQPPPITNHHLRGVFFLNSLTGFAFGKTIVKTIDGGASWISCVDSTNDMMYSGFFMNTSTGFLCGANGTILQTTNSGVNW